MIPEKKILFIVTLLVVALSAKAQITFQRTYGGQMDDEGKSVRQTFDGGYIIVGSTSSFGNGSYDVILVKTDSLGNGKFSKTYGGANIDRGFDIAQIIDSGYIICGYTNSIGNGGYDAYLIRTDKNGDTLWTKTYGGIDWDFAYSVQQTSDGGYILAGETYSFGNGGNDFYLIKTNSLGDTLWTKTFGGDSSDVANSVQQTFDGGYILTGYTKSFGTGAKDVYLIKTNSVGDTLWTKTFGGVRDEEGNSVKQTSDSGFIIAGYTNSFGLPGYDDFYLVKTNANGDTIWTKTQGSPDNKRATSIVQTLSGGYAFTGLTTGQGNQDPLFWKTDSSGNWEISGSPGGPVEDIGYGIVQTADSGFIIVGSTISYGAGLFDIFLIKIDSLGVAIAYNSVNNLNDLNHNIQIFPNPFTTSATIFFRLEFTANNMSTSFALFDLLGVEVNRQTIPNGVRSFQLNRGQLSNGIYYYKIHSGEKIYGIGKIVIQ